MIESIFRQAQLTARAGRHAFAGRRRLRWRRPAPGVLAATGLSLAALLAVGLELRTSLLQSVFFAWQASRMTHVVEAGSSPQIAFPRGGPHDARLGYRQLSERIALLRAQGYRIERQARMSPALQRHVVREGYAIYPEKAIAGLSVLGRDGAPLFERRYPSGAVAGLERVPPLLTRTLTFIEDRGLVDGHSARRNPAVDWPRFALAVAGHLGGLLHADLRQGGGSTLATQIEKIRHWPDGRTRSAVDKLRQMSGASLRSYLDGSDTRGIRERIVATYLDSMPLGARAAYGEVVGIGSGLRAWFGIDLDAAAAALSAEPDDLAEDAPRALVYKQALGLMLATRRPASYLRGDAAALDRLANRYLRALADGGVISPSLRDAALALRLRFTAAAAVRGRTWQSAYKAAHRLRVRLMPALGVDRLSTLDRLDLTVESTIDTRAQHRVALALRRLSDPEYARTRGLIGPHLLGEQGLDRIVYGIVLYERGADRNRLRLRADSHEGPFDVNSGAKLVMGSSAKLRTLVTYLNVIAELHGRLASVPEPELRAAARSSDRLTAWAAAHLLAADDRGLQPMLDASMRRRYSASPYETFFTGGGAHIFHNYRRSENAERPTVEDAFRRSINLAFVRLLRDVVDYYIDRSGANQALAHEHAGASRRAYLMRFADREGIEFLTRFYKDYRGLSADAALARLATRVSAASVPLTVAFRSVRPAAGVGELRAFLHAQLGAAAPSADRLGELHVRYAPEQFGVSDRGYLAGVHPLELWLVAYLQAHPRASYSEVMRASMNVRQQAYAWLFRTRHGGRQDKRIGILLEADAFRAIHDEWRRQGYPFSRLVPSLATAIGSSGDRPDALADLVGVILNDGLRLPDTEIEALHFAPATPYETRMTWMAPPAERVFAPEVAATARRALQGVVDHGTAQRLRGAYRGPDCELLRAGGKTGTADERFKTFGADGRVLRERHVGRTATFVFFLGDRFFGTVTAYVAGEESAQFSFTSSMVVQLLRELAPELSTVTDGSSSALLDCGLLAGRSTATG